MSFTKNSFPAIRNDINSALAEVGRKYGMQLAIDRITFTDTTFRTTVNAVLNTTITPISNTPITFTDTTFPSIEPVESSNEIKWKAQFMAHPSRFGMSATDFGKQIKLRGQLMTIMGARPRSNDDIVLKKVGSSTFVAYHHQVVVDALKIA